MCLGRAGKMPCLNPGISRKERCCPSRKNRQPWSPSSPRAVGLPWALPHPEVLELRGHWGSWHHPGRVSTQLRLRQCGKHPVLGSPAQTERWRRQLGSRRRMERGFLEQQQARRGSLSSTAEGTSLALLSPEITPFPRHSGDSSGLAVLMFNPWTGTACCSQQGGGVSLWGQQWVAGHTHEVTSLHRGTPTASWHQQHLAPAP